MIRKTVKNLHGNEVWADKRYISIDCPEDHWKNMPDFKIKPSTVYCAISFEFESQDDVQTFANTIGQTIHPGTKSIWHPKLNIGDFSKVRYVSNREPENSMKYPIYIPSKGRHKNRLTSDTLIKMGIKHYIVVEESEYDLYLKVCNPDFVTVLVIPQSYFDEYETLDDLGSTKSKGPGPARNFAWEHSISMGHKRHWVCDDNVQNFYRLNNSKRVIVSDSAIFRAMEDHADSYENVYMSGPHYRFFVLPNKIRSPFSINTRIYSTNLILNDIPFRWRGRYNEDTILSLDILASGNCTFQYYAFLSGKVKTQSIKGGNTDEFYSKEGTKPKSQMLKDVYPDITDVVWKFNRWHHIVDYSKFRGNRLKTNIDFVPNISDNNYGMKLVEIN